MCTHHQCLHLDIVDLKYRNLLNRPFSFNDVMPSIGKIAVIFSREILQFINPIFPAVLPDGVLQLILMMYMFPTKISVSLPDQTLGDGHISGWTAHIWLCPECIVNWNLLNEMLMDIFALSYICGDGKMYILNRTEIADSEWREIDRNEWISLKWNHLKQDMIRFEWRPDVDTVREPCIWDNGI